MMPTTSSDRLRTQTHSQIAAAVLASSRSPNSIWDPPLPPKVLWRAAYITPMEALKNTTATGISQTSLKRNDSSLTASTLGRLPLVTVRHLRRLTTDTTENTISIAGRTAGNPYSTPLRTAASMNERQMWETARRSPMLARHSPHRMYCQAAAPPQRLSPNSTTNGEEPKTLVWTRSTATIAKTPEAPSNARSTRESRGNLQENRAIKMQTSKKPQ